MGNEIVLTAQKSEYDCLIMQIRRLKLATAALTVEKDDLELNVCRKLSAEYDRKIGHMELEITRYNLEIERLRSVIESMQAAVNRGQSVSREAAEQQADEKFKGFFEDLEKSAGKAREDEEFARQRNARDNENRQGRSFDDDEDVNWEKLFEDLGKFKEFYDSFFRESDSATKGEEAGGESDGRGTCRKNVNPDKELRMLYLKIMKALHPDNKPDRTDRDDQLLLEARQAFESGDLNRLREIAQMLEDDDIEGRFNDTPEGIEELKRLLQQLIEQRDALVKSIDRIKSSFPYNTKQFLADPEAVAARQKELQEIIESCRNTIAALRERIEQLQKEMDLVAGS